MLLSDLNLKEKDFLSTQSYLKKMAIVLYRIDRCSRRLMRTKMFT